jgi:hypothetical protein
MEVPTEIYLLFHEGCSRGHWTLREVKQCAGRWVHNDEVARVAYTRKENDNGAAA